MIAQHSTGPVRVWLDTAEVAVRTRTPEATVRSWRRRGIGPAYCRVGRRVLYDIYDVDDFILTGRMETTGSVFAPGPERPTVFVIDGAL
ncbi:helix-turn-helix domain-containing protein [Modestobacter sp. VKM Ac-2985]|uniref:helix-turn-helix domain-containing protein n=1 Tax=Modestobacter sp. VKM Ac-2985 TaxID=3004139 RepID=UPI0022AB74C4|nr:helix-turn-helix domain-containing protein [Modestobacter sp. VKM Ac-2985]MCZ2837093.1 helix-turn-helix domain-containing protein [Modestobacter sp. VKM Ac-2985]